MKKKKSDKTLPNIKSIRESIDVKNASSTPNSPFKRNLRYT